MEFTLSGSSLKTFARSITFLARIGNELAIEASPSELAFHTLNSSRSAYNVITFKPDFFDELTVNASQIKCSILLKAVCSVLRTPIANMDHLGMQLPDSDAPKVKWTLGCFNGIRKTYWTTCNVEPEIQHLSLDRARYPSNFVVRPRDLTRLLGNFQSSLQEITIIATERDSLPSDAANEIGGKAVELRSYIDPTKENDSSLHTQLWIDPLEEFVQYTHSGDPVDITFGVKELKAFLSFCEGCEIDIHLYFEKAGEPILLTPKFGVDDIVISSFGATLVLATMLVSQLHEGSAMQAADADATRQGQTNPGVSSRTQQEKNIPTGSEDPSNHTRIWSELSGSAAKSGSGSDGRQAVGDHHHRNIGDQMEIQRLSNIQISKDAATTSRYPHTVILEGNERFLSQRHPSNWVDPGEDDEDDENDLCVQSTPPCYEEE